jgi:hypothetical protein
MAEEVPALILTGFIQPLPENFCRTTLTPAFHRRSLLGQRFSPPTGISLLTISDHNHHR